MDIHYAQIISSYLCKYTKYLLLWSFYCLLFVLYVHLQCFYMLFCQSLQFRGLLIW
nr:MAG TPA: hypothetical protein [Caudoviricetes sp.]